MVAACHEQCRQLTASPAVSASKHILSLAWSCLQVTEQALRMGTALVHASDADGTWAHLCGDLLDDAEVIRNRCLNLQRLAWLPRVHPLHGHMLLCSNITSLCAGHSEGARTLCLIAALSNNLLGVLLLLAVHPVLMTASIASLFSIVLLPADNLLPPSC